MNSGSAEKVVKVSETTVQCGNKDCNNGGHLHQIQSQEIHKS